MLRSVTRVPQKLQSRRIILLLLAEASAVLPAFAEAPFDRQQPPRNCRLGACRQGVQRRCTASRREAADAPCAAGRMAVDALMRGPPDGATVLLVPVIGPLVFKDLSDNPTRDFAPVSQVAKHEFALAVAQGPPARDVAELVAWAKSICLAATSPPGSPQYWISPCCTGTAGFVSSRLQGRCAQRSCRTFPRFASRGTRRSKQPDGMLSSLGRDPSPLIQRLSNDIVTALGTPGMRARFVDLGMEPTGTTPEELGSLPGASCRPP